MSITTTLSSPRNESWLRVKPTPSNVFWSMSCGALIFTSATWQTASFCNSTELDLVLCVNFGFSVTARGAPRWRSNAALCATRSSGSFLQPSPLSILAVSCLEDASVSTFGRNRDKYDLLSRLLDDDDKTERNSSCNRVKTENQWHCTGWSLHTRSTLFFVLSLWSAICNRSELKNVLVVMTLPISELCNHGNRKNLYFNAVTTLHPNNHASPEPIDLQAAVAWAYLEVLPGQCKTVKEAIIVEFKAQSSSNTSHWPLDRYVATLRAQIGRRCMCCEFRVDAKVCGVRSAI